SACRRALLTSTTRSSAEAGAGAGAASASAVWASAGAETPRKMSRRESRMGAGRCNREAARLYHVHSQPMISRRTMIGRMALVWGGRIAAAPLLGCSDESASPTGPDGGDAGADAGV